MTDWILNLPPILLSLTDWLLKFSFPLSLLKSCCRLALVCLGSYTHTHTHTHTHLRGALSLCQYLCGPYLQPEHKSFPVSERHSPRLGPGRSTLWQGGTQILILALSLSLSLSLYSSLSSSLSSSPPSLPTHTHTHTQARKCTLNVLSYEIKKIEAVWRGILVLTVKNKKVIKLFLGRLPLVCKLDIRCLCMHAIKINYPSIPNTKLILYLFIIFIPL